MRLSGRNILLCSIALLAVMDAVSFARSYSKVLCNQPGYYCIHVRGGQSWYSLWPDEHDRGIVMRINRMNTHLWGGLTIAVPENLQSGDIMDYSPFPSHINSENEKVVVIDPAQVAWGAYDADGNLVRWGPASSGSDYCRDIGEPCRTHSGTFRVFSLGSSDCISKKFPLPDGGAPMPYCMYFNNGQALHGEPNGLPGYNDSHGCVRMYVNDAEWMRYEFIEGPNSNNHFRGTKVIVKPYAYENEHNYGEMREDEDDQS